MVPVRLFGLPGRGHEHHHHDHWDYDAHAERQARRRRHRRRRRAAAAAAAAAAGGLYLGQHGGGSPEQPAQSGSIDAILLRLHNEVRKSAGCGPLHLDGKLDKAAEGKADDMARYSYMSHTNHDGSFFDKRITRSGYDWSTVGENIGEGFSSPTSVMTAWIHSPEHYANIVSCKYHDVGFGEKDGYWATEFGAKQ